MKTCREIQEMSSVKADQDKRNEVFTVPSHLIQQYTRPEALSGRSFFPCFRNQTSSRLFDP